MDGLIPEESALPGVAHLIELGVGTLVLGAGNVGFLTDGIILRISAPAFAVARENVLHLLQILIDSPGGFQERQFLGHNGFPLGGPNIERHQLEEVDFEGVNEF